MKKAEQVAAAAAAAAAIDAINGQQLCAHTQATPCSRC